MLTGENGILKKAMDAKEETQIKAYYEKIELIRNELRLEKENYLPPTIAEMKEEFDKHQTDWVASTEIKQVDGIETLELKTKEGYIFHITETGTEYKGKGEIVDTSALKREDALKLEIVGEGTNGGKLVQITNLSGVDYYKIEYAIDNTEGNWTTIESGSKVDVPPNATIYARLTYGTSKGVIVSLSIEASAPTIIAKNTDTSQVVRKTQTPLAELFEITWGSDGTGTAEYSVTGNLNFKNTTFNSTEISNLSELEVGNYTVTCKVTSPSNKQATATKQNVKVTKLANTTVTNASNSNVTASAIYSEYDLAYFRDLVNGGQFTINGKLMNDINLSKVCSTSIGNWTPIGEYNSTSGLASVADAKSFYNGIFDGNNNQISNIYINATSLYRQGLFAISQMDSLIKNLSVNGSVTAYQNIGGIVAFNGGTILNCKNIATINGENIIGGIVGAHNRGRIEGAVNEGTINGKKLEVGGIAGKINNPIDETEGIIRSSNNIGTVVGGSYVGGIVGNTLNTKIIIDNCYNLGKVEAIGYEVDSDTVKNSYVGGIVGYNVGTVQKCYNKIVEGNATVNTIEGEYGSVGGIVGANTNVIKECYNTKFVLRKA